MRAAQIKERERIMDRVCDIVNSAPSETDPAVVTTARSAIDELNRIVKQQGEDDSFEAAKTWKYLGDAYWYAASRKDQEALSNARRCYYRAEAGYASDPVATAKLNFNLGNVLRLIDKGFNYECLLEAKRRYMKAAQLLRLHQPEMVQAVDRSIRDLEPAICALPLMQRAEADQQRARKLKAELEADPAASGQKLREIQNAIDELNRASPAMEQALVDGQFDSNMALLLKQMQSSLEQGAMAPDKKGAMEQLLEEFARTFKDRPDRAEGMAARSERLRKIADRFKGMYMARAASKNRQ
jgi:hypothetical protein